MASRGQVSRLDNLPNELLIMFFKVCDNGALLSLYPHLFQLAAKVDDDRSHLITICCQDSRLNDPKPNFAHDDLRILMQQEWLSLHKLWESMWAWTERAIRSEMDLFLEAIERAAAATPQVLVPIGSGSIELIRTELQEGLLKYRSLDGRKADNGPLVDGGTCETLVNRIMSHQSSDASLDYMFRVTYQRPQQTLRMNFSAARVEAHGVYMPVYWRTSALTFVKPIHTYSVFPETFLEGPWTQRDGNVFGFFMGFVRPSLCTGPLTIEQNERIDRGLTCAIESGCLPALAVLGGAATINLRYSLIPKTDPELSALRDSFLNPQNNASSAGECGWTKPVILPAGDVITAFRWSPAHANALLKQARLNKESHIWQRLVRDLSDELSTTLRENYIFKDRIQKDIESYIAELGIEWEQHSAWNDFQSSQLWPALGGSVASRIRARTQQRFRDPKTHTQGFVV